MTTGKIQSNNAFGYSDLQTFVPAFVGDFAASAAITTVPVVVAIGTDGKVATAATNGTASLARGIALTTASTTNKVVKVAVLGMAENVPAAGAVAAGDLVKRSGTTAGYVSATATPVAGEVLGVAINASSSNTVDVWVLQGGALS